MNRRVGGEEIKQSVLCNSIITAEQKSVEMAVNSWCSIKAQDRLLHMAKLNDKTKKHWKAGIWDGPFCKVVHLLVSAVFTKDYVLKTGKCDSQAIAENGRHWVCLGRSNHTFFNAE